MSIALFVAFAIARAVVVAVRVARAVRPVVPLVCVAIGALPNRIVPVAIAAVVHPLPIAVRVAACVRRLLVAAGSLLRPEDTRSIALAVWRRWRTLQPGVGGAIAVDVPAPEVVAVEVTVAEAALVDAGAVAEYLVALEVERQTATGVEFSLAQPFAISTVVAVPSQTSPSAVLNLEDPERGEGLGGRGCGSASNGKCSEKWNKPAKHDVDPGAGSHPKLQTMSQRGEADFTAVNWGQTQVMACSGVRLG